MGLIVLSTDDCQVATAYPLVNWQFLLILTSAKA